MKGKNLKRIIAFIMVFAMILSADAAMLATVFAESQQVETEATNEEPGEPVDPVKPVEQEQEQEEEPEPEEEPDSEDEQEPKEEEKPEEKPEGEMEEEIEETEEEEEEIVEEPMTISLTSQGITIEISAEAGVLPEGTKIQVNPLSDDEIDMYLNAIEEQKEDILMGYATLFDIVLLDANDNIIQPNGEVKVSFYGLDHIKEDDDVFIYHVEAKETSMRPSGSMVNMQGSSSANDVDIEDFDVEVESGKISFDTDHFSIYIVGTNIKHENQNNNQRYQMYVGDTVDLEERISRNDGFWSIDQGSGNARVVSSSGRNATIEATNTGNATVRYIAQTGGPTQTTNFYIRVNARGSHDEIDPADEPTTDPDALNPGTVAAEKTARWVDYGNRIAKINLSVEGMPIKGGSDVILVMDVSLSMQTGSRINTAREASNQFVSNLLGDGNPLNNRVAFIPFHGSSGGGTGQSEVNNVTSGRVNFSYDMGRLTSHISNVPVGLYTNYSAALQKAIEYSNSREEGEESRPLYIVFMSDGEPNPGSFNGQAQADTLKGSDYNATIYTVGIQLGSGSSGNTARNRLQNLASTIDGTNLYADVSNMSDLAPILTRIASETKIAGTNAVFKDFIADEFEFYSSAPYVSDGAYDSDDESVTINVGNITEEAKTFKIYVRLKTEHNEEGEYFTNDNIHLDYTDVNDASAHKDKDDIGHPKLSVGYGTIAIRYVLVNDSGQYVSRDDPLVILEEAHRHFVPTHNFSHLFNVSGSTELDLDRTYTVSSTVPEGYTLYNVGETIEQELNFTNTNPTVEFKVVAAPIVNYTVTYLPGDQGTFAAQVTEDLAYGDNTPAFDGIPAGNLGYYFTGWTPEVSDTVTGNATYVAQWSKQTKITITANSDTKVYNGEVQSVSGYVISGELLSGHELSEITATGSGINVETYPVTIVGNPVIKDSQGNIVTHMYKINKVNGTLTMTKRPITITSADDSKEYDGIRLTNSGFNVTSGTLVAGQEADVEVTGGITNIGTLPNSIGEVKILDGDIDVTDNYEINVVTGRLTITPKEVIITVGDAEKVYGTEDPDFTGTVTGLINDYDLILSGYRRINNDEDVGVYEDVLIPEFVISSNYTVTVNKGTFTINKAIGADLIIEDYEGIYDGDSHSIEVLNTIEGDTVYYKVGSGNWTTTNPGFADVGEYTVQVKVENPNYLDRTGVGKVKITPRAITIKANDGLRVYNGLPLINLGHQVTNGELVGEHNSVAVVLGGRTDAGESQNELRSVRIFDRLRDVTKNYDITKENGTLTVTPRPITVTANSASKVYDGTPLSNSGFEITSGSLVSLQRLSATVTGSRTDVGTEPNEIDSVKIRDSIFGVVDFTDNYEIIPVDGLLEVTRATGVDLEIEGYEGIYDGDPHSIEVTNTIDEDKVFYSLDGDDWSEEKPEFTDVGEYKVLVKVENPNYEDRLGEGTVEITPKSVTIVVNNASKRVGQADPIFSGTVEGLINEDDLGEIVYNRTNADVNTVGVYPEVLTAEFEDNPNYTVEITNGDFTINSAPGPGPTPVPPELNDPDPPELNLEDHFAYIQGYPDNTVRPEGLVSREEVAAVFYRLLTDESRNALMTTSNNFPDVASSRWSNRHISTLVNGGIIQGYNDGTFKPGSSITRAELATIASRFDNLSPFVADRFSDISGHWANEYINSAADKGWVNGYPDGTFRPNQAITRAEFVTLVNAVLERRVHAENILEDARVFPDLSESAWYYEAMQEAINSHTYVRLEDGYEEWIEIYYPELDM